MYKVTAISIWEKPQTMVFGTIEEARDWAAEMRDQQYSTKIEEATDDEFFE